MGNLTLYDITSGFTKLIEAEDITPEDKEKINQELTELLQEKSPKVIGYIRNNDLTIEAMKTEEKRISEQRKALENKNDKFKAYVKACMENNNIEKIETALGSLSVARSPVSVEIIDENKIPSEYKTEVITTKVDKKKIADNFKSTGELIDGVVIHTENTNLRVR